MHSPDFLHKGAETKLCEQFVAAGAVCSLQTNSKEVLDAARDTFLPIALPAHTLDFSMRLWVDRTRQSGPPWPKPYVRGLDHLIFAGFDEDSSVLANLRNRHVIGRFSERMAGDQAYFKYVIFPMLLTIVGASLGAAELHAACVVNNEHGLLLAGPSGSGKSTLSLALAKSGFGFVSDDRTFCSVQNDGVHVWGMPTRLKLRPKSVRWFSDLQGLHTTRCSNGDADVWLDPEQIAGVTRRRDGRATSLIVLERGDAPEFRLSPMSFPEALNRLNQEMMPELPEAIAKRSKTIRQIAKLPCWLLQYGGEPHQVARHICAHIAKSEGDVPVRRNA